jgi:hypothetical protein
VADLWHYFAACGFASWLCMLCAMLAVPLCIAALALAFSRARGSKIVAVLAFVASLMPMSAGLFGMLLGRAKVDKVLEMPGLTPQDKERIRQMGYEEANGCLTIGGVLGALPLVLGVTAVAVAFGRRPKASS